MKRNSLVIHTFLLTIIIIKKFDAGSKLEKIQNLCDLVENIDWIMKLMTIYFS